MVWDSSRGCHTKNMRVKTALERQGQSQGNRAAICARMEAGARGFVKRTGTVTDWRSCVKHARLTQPPWRLHRAVMSQNAKRVVVIGGANADIQAVSARPVQLRTSNPGRITVAPGGVGRNVAEVLARLGADVALITVFGQDPVGLSVRAATEAAGVDCRAALTSRGATPTYAALHDADGEMVVAVAAMDALRELTVVELEQRRELLIGADAIVIEANLEPDVIGWVTSTFPHTPIFADPVSVPKATRLSGVVPRVFGIKPNLEEAAVLVGFPTTDEGAIRRAAKALCDSGVQWLAISLGAAGVYARSAAGDEFTLPALPVDAVSVSGAGDAFLAAMVWSHLESVPFATAIELSRAAAAITIESSATVAPEICAATVHSRCKGEHHA